MTGQAWVVLTLFLIQAHSMMTNALTSPDLPAPGFINGGFESPLTAQENPYVFRDETVAREGAYSLQLVSHGNGMASYRVRSQSRVSGTVTITGWSRGQGVSGMQDENHAVKIQFVDDRGHALSQQNLPLPVGDYDWTRWTHTVTLPEDRTFTVVVYPFFGTTHTGAVWHDAISLIQP